MPVVEFSPEDFPKAQGRAEIGAKTAALRGSRGVKGWPRQFLDDIAEQLDLLDLLTPTETIAKPLQTSELVNREAIRPRPEQLRFWCHQ